jgi:hypothetical protein
VYSRVLAEIRGLDAVVDHQRITLLSMRVDFRSTLRGRSRWRCCSGEDENAI